MISKAKQKELSAVIKLGQKGIYGYELILDLHQCDVGKFNRKSIDAYFESLCKAIKMIRDKRVWWDDYGVPKEEKQTAVNTTGPCSVQFILTSSIVIHSLTKLRSAYINIFSCKPFRPEVAKKLTKDFFDSKIVISHFITRTYIR